MPRISDDAFRAALGARIRHARVAAGLSQGALGAQLGVSFQQVQKYELGRDGVSVETLVRLAAALGRPAAELLEEGPGVDPLPAPAIRARLRSADAVDGLAPELRRPVLALLAVLPRAAAAPSAAA